MFYYKYKIINETMELHGDPIQGWTYNNYSYCFFFYYTTEPLLCTLNLKKLVGYGLRENPSSEGQ